MTSYVIDKGIRRACNTDAPGSREAGGGGGGVKWELKNTKM